MLNIGIKELLEAGVHFGHQTRRWNPKMKPFIFEARNGIHIIDLSKTTAQLETACSFLFEIARRGDEILFVGTKKQAQSAVKEAAVACGAMYVTERWLGGTLTNFATLKRSLERLRHIEKMETDGTILNYVKQEQSMLRREAARFRKNLDGIRAMSQKMPSALFIVDLKREHNAVAEARRLKIPIVAIVDTNCDPGLADYPVAGNDDAIRAVRLILQTIMDFISRGRAEYESKYARRKPSEAGEATAAPATPPPGAPAPGAEAPAAEPLTPVSAETPQPASSEGASMAHASPASVPA